MSRYFDCTYIGIDRQTGKHIVRELLYPEARGWVEHEFSSEVTALEWLEGLRADPT